MNFLKTVLLLGIVFAFSHGIGSFIFLLLVGMVILSVVLIFLVIPIPRR